MAPRRRPRNRGRNRRKKTAVKKSKVSQLHTPEAWERAKASSNRRYLVLHVYQGASRGSFASSFANIAASKQFKHMLFAECSIDSFEDVKAAVAAIRSPPLPLLLLWHNGECIKHCAPPRQPASSMFMGMSRSPPSMYAFPNQAMRFLEDLAPEAPRPKPVAAIVASVATLVLTLSGVLIGRKLGWGEPEPEPTEEDLALQARGEELLPDGRAIAELDPPVNFEFEEDVMTDPREDPENFEILGKASPEGEVGAVAGKKKAA